MSSRRLYIKNHKKRLMINEYYGERKMVLIENEHVY
jgi:hypothetical protein